MIFGPYPDRDRDVISPTETQSLVLWTEAVTLTSVRGSGNVILEDVPAGVYRVSLREAAASNGVYLQGDIRVTVGMSRVTVYASEFPPKPRDFVEWSDSGESLRYIVTEVTGSKWQRFWSVTARCPRIAYDLRQQATIKRPAASSTEEGLRTLGEPTSVIEGVDCRLQPESFGIESELNGRIGSRSRYTLFLAGDVPVQAGDYVEVDSVIYEIVSQAVIDPLATFTQTTCERTG